jgi:2-dehydro-3-deoxyphosphogluconate aldolase / (4S)-4-hydroxy-2-oxoglutarate aldolase
MSYDKLISVRVIAIVRGNYSLPTYRAMADALLTGGITTIEITLNSGGAMDAIRMLVQEFSDRMTIGAGTILEVDQVKPVAAAGATFGVSPDTNPAVTRALIDNWIEPVPGAFTATEVMTAHRAGARFVKLFPAGVVGVDYLKALRGPLPHIQFVTTGNVKINDVRAFLDAGAVAVGIGGELVSPNFDGSPGAVAELKVKARRVMELATGQQSVLQSV